MKRVLHWIGNIYGVFAVLLFLLLLGFLWSGNYEAKERELSPGTPVAEWDSGDFDLDPEDAPRVVLDVDYAGPGPWKDLSEPEILEKLVEEGTLPPVEERVGSQPVVMQGVEGNGKYGGTWIRGVTSERNVLEIWTRLSYANLVRWSAMGEPIVPHIARSWEHSDDMRTWTFHIRKGIRWSDGELFTVDDILYWWENEARHPGIGLTPHSIMRHRGKWGEVRKIDELTVEFAFEDPHPLFLKHLATRWGRDPVFSPEHYLRQYHPDTGDSEAKARASEIWNISNDFELYRAVKFWNNPEIPRMWPWVYREYRNSPPHVFVRNPYYFAVDTEGRQLPYMDRLLYQVKSSSMLEVAASQGELMGQNTGVEFKHYTLLMSQKDQYGYSLRHWSNGIGSRSLIHPNLNKAVEKGNHADALKAELLREKTFRQALSLAIDRKAIIATQFAGVGKPLQIGPNPGSPYHVPGQREAYTEFNPERAEAMLDELGLFRPPGEEYRQFPDGTPLILTLDYSDSGGAGSTGLALALVRDWKRVGIRLAPFNRSRQRWLRSIDGRTFDFVIAGTQGEFLPEVDPRLYVATYGSYYAMKYAKWYVSGGFYNSDSVGENLEGPPEDSPLYRSMEAYDRFLSSSEETERQEAFREILRIAGENLWTINISLAPPELAVVQDGLRNVPEQLVYAWRLQSPGNASPETFYLENPSDSAGATKQIEESIRHVTLPGNFVSVEQQRGSGLWSKFTVFLVVAIVVGLLLLVIFRHPYIGHRLLIMIPTLVVVSVLCFIIIQLPPGDYLTSLIAELEQSGESIDERRISEIKEMFHLDEPVFMQYLHWVGIPWFWTFDEEDKGLLQGNLGRSMETFQSVNSVLGDRILLTLIVSLSTIFFTWIVALPFGILSAVKQYSPIDYIITFLGFLGMCIPNFLFALLLMFFSARMFGIEISGLFSPEYAAQPEWTYGKFIDLLQHIWVPVLVTGTAGTAGLIRIMRGNLLDELKKPYVTTAKAKGVRPVKLILKYPVRIALNPFISGIAQTFPQMISGGAIVAMILSLPTIGPMLIRALLSEDMYLAGSIIMIMSMLGVLGTLVSDILLLLLDPRIQMQGKGKR